MLDSFSEAGMQNILDYIHIETKYNATMSVSTGFEDSPLPFASQPTTEEQESAMVNLKLLFDRYEDTFTTYPKEKGWISENMYMYQGFWFNSKRVFSIETFLATQDTFQAHPNDIYLATMMKSGTTWLKAIVFAIVNRNRYKAKPHPLSNFNPHICVPGVHFEVLRTNPTYVLGHSPRLFATHIPYTLLPKSIISSDCRIVYMCRNPKDVLISLFHFANKLRDKSHGLLTLEEAFKMFSKGVCPSGPYWDHVKGYYKASLEYPTKILFLTYENMKLDTTNNVKHLAEFLSYPFTEEENVKGVVDEIVSLCSFENLSEVNKDGNFSGAIANNSFFRKGIVGDWSNHLTTEMSQILDQITTESFYSLDISF